MARFPKNDIMSLTEANPRYDLAESYGPNLRLGDLLDGQRLDDLPLAYGSAAGDLQLRQIIADGHGVGAEDVVITVGGAHALFLTAFVLCGPGDEAVTTAPLFPQARNVLDAVGAEVRSVPLSFDAGYRLDPAEVGRLLSAKTRLVSLASPQNPSGVAVPVETIRALLDLMSATCPEAHLLVDETYREAAYGQDPVAPGMAALSPKIISTASLSKAHGGPGLRLGWAITRDPALREQLILGKFNTVICCSPVDEALAKMLLGRSEQIISDRRQRLADGLTRTAAWIERHARFVEWVRPDAGALCCIRLKPSLSDAAALARFQEALASEGVRLADGAWFGAEAGVFRLGFGLLSMPDLDTALARLSIAIDRAARATA
ncbi:MAG TPA: pyridoxal phosphate-dependent aminotransferase [Aliidongia sp.]|uniref:pyridoxal phosphate-dependent aminotransferase n=1 Tax=Aliidongia sp. TaxID=1914230 RepID=UPI002DDCEF18|nr:pyridoxal phosphate-dependent aminotransferase [Aliidongia sp.]HEV2676897.1 pyridoxal phosphate-dependent aminotransferase [Aliidongia sp.]